jgi:opacity protein-like surface antigen
MTQRIVLLLSIIFFSYAAEASYKYHNSYNKNYKTYRYYHKDAHANKNLFVIGEFSTAPQVKASGDKSLVTKSTGYTSSLPNFNIGIGKHFNNFLHSALTFGYRDFNYKNQHIYPDGDIANQSHNAKLYSLMLNNYLTTDLMRNFLSGYLLLGVGCAQMKPGNFNTTNLISGSPSSDSTLSENSTNIIYQVGLGTITKTTKNIGIDTSIRYVSYGKMKFLNAKNINLKAFESTIGLKFDLR